MFAMLSEINSRCTEALLPAKQYHLCIVAGFSCASRRSRFSPLLRSLLILSLFFIIVSCIIVFLVFTCNRGCSSSTQHLIGCFRASNLLN